MLEVGDAAVGGKIGEHSAREAIQWVVIEEIFVRARRVGLEIVLDECDFALIGGLNAFKLARQFSLVEPAAPDHDTGDFVDVRDIGERVFAVSSTKSARFPTSTVPNSA